MMNKKFCVVVIALIMLCMATGAVFAAQYEPTLCSAHHNRWRDNCRDCRIAQRNIEKNKAAAKLRQQKKRLEQKQEEKAAAQTVEEEKEIEKEIGKITRVIIRIEADLLED